MSAYGGVGVFSNSPEETPSEEQMINEILSLSSQLKSGKREFSHLTRPILLAPSGYSSSQILLRIRAAIENVSTTSPDRIQNVFLST